MSGERPSDSQQPNAILPLGPPGVAALRLLELQTPEEQIADELTRKYLLEPPASVEDLKEIVRRTAQLARGSRLLPPSEAAFLLGSGAQAPELDQLQALAVDLLNGYVSGSGLGGAPDAQTTRPRRAFKYAEALLQQEWAIEARDGSRLRSELAADEQSRLDDCLLFWCVLAGPQTLEGWLDGWERLVLSVESQPKQVLPEEFDGLLPVRDRLAEAIALIAPSGKASLTSEVAALDERFRRATLPVERAIRTASPWSTQAWWWFRTPAVLSSAFQARLTSGANGVVDVSSRSKP